ncbi:MAG: hypothetical protein IT275_07415 [Chitinophagales bacterium]|nr:hypothetical protein [Chitinophagales bacterium]
MIDQKMLLPKIKSVVATLREKADKVEQMTFGNPQKVLINLKDLPKFIKNKKRGDLYYKEALSQNAVLKDIIIDRSGAVYLFHLPEGAKDNQIIEALRTCHKETGRVVPSLTHIDNRKPSVLYIGSVKSHFGNRFCQHLGYGAQRTGALQLIHWADKGLFNEIEMTYFPIEFSVLALHTQAEIIMCKAFTPLIGRMERDKINQ